MSVQKAYNYNPTIGAAGGIVDLAPYEINTFLNEEDTGAMVFGVAVVAGTKPGVNVKLADANGQFVGVTVNNRTTEYDIEGNIHIRHGKPLGVMAYGRIFARLADGIEPEFGEQAYVITSGDEQGYFTNASTGNKKINAKFVGKANNGVVELELIHAME